MGTLVRRSQLDQVSAGPQNTRGDRDQDRDQAQNKDQDWD